MKKILNLKLLVLLEYQNVKTFLQKSMFQIGLKNFLLLKKLKILFRGHMLLVILKVIVELKIKLLVMIMIIILLFQNLIS